MSKLKRISVLLFCCFFIFMTGCNKDSTTVSTDASKGKANVYYSNSEGNNLVKREIDISKIDDDEVVEFLMQEIIKNPKEEDIKSALRNGTKCLWANKDNNLVSVNLSKEFYNDDNMADILGLGAIVKTLCSVNGIDSVNVFVENNPITDSKGEEMGILKDSDFVFSADALDSDEENITLYFGDENGENLVAEVRRIKVPKGEVMEKLVVSELIKGPEKGKNTATIPEGTKIISVETKDGVCFVNLSKEFVDRHPGGTSAENLTIYSVVNSLAELGNILKVQFLIDGEKRDIYKHIMFNEPFERDMSLIVK